MELDPGKMDMSRSRRVPRNVWAGHSGWRVPSHSHPCGRGSPIAAEPVGHLDGFWPTQGDPFLGIGCPLTRQHLRRRISFKGSLSEVQVRESSLELLKGYLGDIVDAIVGSVEKCPLLMRVAFKQLRRRVEERFPSAQHEVGQMAGTGLRVHTPPGPPPQALSCPCPRPGGAVLLHQWVSLPPLLRPRCPYPKALQPAGAACRSPHWPHAPAACQGVGGPRVGQKT